jgi:phage shock protein PspC (stress-responsive transcriptional regulator)
MNKTVTINISGIIFHIEEDAYEKLSKYLAAIKSLFNKADGGNEIMSDIESRIAEMLQGKTSAIKQVVLMSDVDYVIDNMGKPEEFASEAMDAGDTDTEAGNTTDEPVKRRLFRDGDSKVIGGVCSGVAHYFGFDPVWLRIALLALFFFAGTGFLLYLILWIAIPEAKTTADRLMMKGEKADINNISKAVKEEAEQLKKRMEKYGKDFRDLSNRAVPRNAVEKTIDFMADVLTNIGRVLLKILGVLMVIFGLVLFLGLFSSVFGVSFMTSNIEGSEWIDMFLLDGKDFYLGLIGIAIFVGTPIVMLIYAGVKILFKVRYTNRWINMAAGILWLIGFIMLIYVGTRTSKDFSKVAKLRENVVVQQNDTLVLKMVELGVDYGELEISDAKEEGERNYYHKRRAGYMMGKHDNTRYMLGSASLNVIKSQNGMTDLVIVKEARGNSKDVARLRAKHIAYNVTQQNNELIFDDLFRVNSIDKFRKQDVTAILRIPVGTVIYLDRSMEGLIYDIENATNTYDGDMVGRRWKMTEAGLVCVDCDGLVSVQDYRDGKYERDDSDNEEVNINVNGVNINAKDASINVDSNGVNINSKESKVVIDKHGVYVNTKKDK